MGGKGNCNLALLSIMKLDGTFTWAVDNFHRIAAVELPPTPPSIFGKCVLGLEKPIGGFRQIRKFEVSLAEW